MKNIKNFFVILLLALAMLMSVSCIRTREKNEEVGISRTESGEKNDKKNSKKNEANKKKKDSRKDIVVSEIPHILLEENSESSFEPDPSFRYLYSINNVHLKLRENSKEFLAVHPSFHCHRLFGRCSFIAGHRGFSGKGLRKIVSGRFGKA